MLFGKANQKRTYFRTYGLQSINNKYLVYSSYCSYEKKVRRDLGCVCITFREMTELTEHTIFSRLKILKNKVRGKARTTRELLFFQTFIGSRNIQKGDPL